MKAPSATTLMPVKTLCTKRPEPWKWMSDTPAMTPMATSACGVTTSGTYGKRTVRSDV